MQISNEQISNGQPDAAPQPSGQYSEQKLRALAKQYREYAEISDEYNRLATSDAAPSSFSNNSADEQLVDTALELIVQGEKAVQKQAEANDLRDTILAKTPLLNVFIPLDGVDIKPETTAKDGRQMTSSEIAKATKNFVDHHQRKELLPKQNTAAEAYTIEYEQTHGNGNGINDIAIEDAFNKKNGLFKQNSKAFQARAKQYAKQFESSDRDDITIAVAIAEADGDYENADGIRQTVLAEKVTQAAQARVSEQGMAFSDALRAEWSVTLRDIAGLQATPKAVYTNLATAFANYHNSQAESANTGELHAKNEASKISDAEKKQLELDQLDQEIRNEFHGCSYEDAVTLAAGAELDNDTIMADAIRRTVLADVVEVRITALKMPATKLELITENAWDLTEANIDKAKEEALAARALRSNPSSKAANTNTQPDPRPKPTPGLASTQTAAAVRPIPDMASQSSGQLNDVQPSKLDKLKNHTRNLVRHPIGELGYLTSRLYVAAGTFAEDVKNNEGNKRWIFGSAIGAVAVVGASYVAAHGIEGHHHINDSLQHKGIGHQSPATEHLNHHVAHSSPATEHLNHHIGHSSPATEHAHHFVPHRGGTATAHEQVVRLRPGSNPWQVSKESLQHMGNRQPTNAQIAAYDHHLLQLNHLDPKKARYLRIGHQLILPDNAA